MIYHWKVINDWVHQISINTASILLRLNSWIKWKLKYLYSFWQALLWPNLVYDQVQKLNWSDGLGQIDLFFLAKLAYVYKRSLNFDPDFFVDQGDSSKTYEIDNLPSEGPLLTWILDYFKTPSLGLASYESRQSTPHD